jgi:hypothetical protein
MLAIYLGAPILARDSEKRAVIQRAEFTAGRASSQHRGGSLRQRKRFAISPVFVVLQPFFVLFSRI